LDLAGKNVDALCLDQRIEDECGARLALTPPAMAAMHEHGRREHAIAHGFARAPTFRRKGMLAHHEFLLMSVPERMRLIGTAIEPLQRIEPVLVGFGAQ